VARALIVGCGCRGRMLAEDLHTRGWQVRGGSRSTERRELIAAAGIEPAEVDPARLDTVLAHVGDVAVIAWLMGSAVGEGAVDAHRDRLGRLLERLVDTPIRGFLYEGGGSAGQALIGEGRRTVEAAAARFRIPVAITARDPADPPAWLSEASRAMRGFL
jgi:nucleoside-diphosphate-sugar epimerase